MSSSSIFILRIANADAISPAKHCSRLDFKRFVRDIRRILLPLKRPICTVHYAITSKRLISESGMDKFYPCHLCRRRYVAASSKSKQLVLLTYLDMYFGYFWMPVCAGFITYDPIVVFNNTAYPNVGPSLFSSFVFRYDAWSAGGPVVLTDGVSSHRVRFEAIAVPDSTSTLTCDATSVRIVTDMETNQGSSNKSQVRDCFTSIQQVHCW